MVIYNDGNYEIPDQEITQRFDVEKMLLIEKFDPEKIITAVYLDNEKIQYNIKRFKIETTTLNSKFYFIKEGKDNQAQKTVTTDAEPVVFSFFDEIEFTIKCCCFNFKTLDIILQLFIIKINSRNYFIGIIFFYYNILWA